MNRKGFTIVELMAIIVVLGIIITLAFASFKNVGNRVKQEAYQNKISLIETKASDYASGTKILVTNVDQLVKKGYLSADNENGDVLNPIDGSRMNCKVVTMYKSEGNYYAEYLENKEECDASRIDYDNGYTSIEKYLSYEDGRVGNLLESDDWSKENNLLKLIINDKEAIPESEIKEIKWLTNVGEKVTNEKEYLAKTELIIDSEFSAQIELNDGGIYTAKTRVKIDKARPTVTGVTINDKESWTNYGKEVTINAQDEGAGIHSYAVIEEKDYQQLPEGKRCESATNYVEKEDTSYTTHLENGKYYVCVKDKAGNISQDMNEPLFEIDNIDKTAPNCSISYPSPDGKNGWYKSDVPFVFNDGREEEERTGSGIESKQIFINGVEQTKDNYTLNYDTANFKVELNVTDKAGNVCHQEVTVKRATEIKVNIKNNPISLGNQDYDFKDNLEIDYGVSGGTVVCDPPQSLKTGSYTVTCTITIGSGVSKSVSFQARHSYPASASSCNCHEVCDNNYPCSPWDCSGCGGDRVCSVNCGTQYHDTWCCDTPRWVCDTCYSCPNGGSPIGSTCYY